MAKDRFSKFKKSNYDTDYRWGNTANSTNYVSVGKREVLTETQRGYLLGLMHRVGMTEYNKKFIRSILTENKVPTEKQKVVIRKILKYLG